MLLIAVSLITGCLDREAAQQPPAVMDGSQVVITAFLDTDTPCQQPTIEYLQALEAADPDCVHVEVVNISDQGSGRERWEEAGLDAPAITIDGQATVCWEDGEGRRTVSFLHPAGFMWNHEDLGQAVAAALRDELQAGDPAEARGVHLMNLTVRGQSIRVSDGGQETGQLVINDQVVLEVRVARGERGPAQRVTEAARKLSETLATPFTPNHLCLKRAEQGVAVMAGEAELLVATEEDAQAEGLVPEQLANRWRLAIRDALIAVALQRAERAV